MLEKISKSVDVPTVQGLLLQHYGLVGELNSLAGERDHNFTLEQTDGARLIVKIAHEDEAIETLQCQSQMIARVLQKAPDVPVSSEVSNLVGQSFTMVALADGTSRFMRVNRFMPGVALSEVPLTSETRKATGKLVASLADALDGFQHVAAHRKLLWDIQQANSLREHVETLPQEARRLATYFLDRFCDEILPRSFELRHGVIHNDLNLQNLIVDKNDGARITGCIDFGDMVWAPQINDLAIAAAYQLNVRKPLESILDIASAFHRRRALLTIEVDFLTVLIAMRFVLTLAITHWRSKLHPENAPYILRNAPAAFEGLKILREISPEKARDFLYNRLSIHSGVAP